MADRGLQAGMRAGALAAVTLGAAALVGGCASFAGTRGEPMAFSSARAQDRVLDIQVSRRGTRLYLTNTTAFSLDAGTLWINQRFSAPMPALGLGESLVLDLRNFIDDEGATFRAGGFFATRDPDAVVLAQLETSGELLGLVVVENRF